MSFKKSRKSFKYLSMYLIKPDGMLFRDGIINTIKTAGFEILERKQIRINKRIIINLYPYLRRKTVLKELTFDYFLGQTLEIGIVQKKTEKTIRDFAKLCGLNLNPGLCARHSIRYIYYNRPKIRVGHKYFYPNVIHRPKTLKEFVHNFLLFFGRDIVKDLLKK